MRGYGRSVVAVTATRARVRGDIVRLAQRGLGVEDFAQSVSRVLARAVPFDGTCLLTIDPATLLPTGEVVENGLPPDLMGRLMEIELSEPDVNKFVALARGSRPAASLSAATSGDLDGSLRQREIRRPSGFEDELRAVLPGPSGTWGALTLLREVKRPHFTSAEVRFVESLSGALGDGLRRAALLGEAVADDHADAGLLVLAADDSIEMANRSADRWLDELEAGVTLPTVVLAVVAQTRRLTVDDDGSFDALAWARVRTRAGRWVIVRGSLLGDGSPARVAVLLEAARPPELAPLIAEAYGLTERERSVTELVAQGFSTNDIADQLRVTAYTVQDHLKSIFEKSGTRSRGDLVARLFFDHYAPRLAAPSDA